MGLVDRVVVSLLSVQATRDLRQADGAAVVGGAELAGGGVRFAIVGNDVGALRRHVA
eukprot:COSAG02_NODE_64684_length_260_cov_0.515528_1_plen_56_part_01